MLSWPFGLKTCLYPSIFPLEAHDPFRNTSFAFGAVNHPKFGIPWPHLGIGCIFPRSGRHPTDGSATLIKLVVKVLLFLFVTSLLSTIAVADEDLASYRWKNRVLVILAPSDNDPQLKEQRASAAASAAGYLERDLIVVTEIGVDGPIRRKFGIRQSDFQVLLIGKDGHSTLQWPKPVSSEVIFSAIDRMPMRRDEMSKQKTVRTTNQR